MQKPYITGKQRDYAKTEIGRRISTYRSLAGIKREELADKLNISNSFMGKYEKGSHSFPSDLLAVTAEILNVKINDLVGQK